MEDKKAYWGILGLVAGVIVALGVSHAVHTERQADLGFGFNIDIGPFGLDFGSRDYYYTCYYDEYGNYYCDNYGYGPYYYGYPGYYGYGRGYYYGRGYGYRHGHRGRHYKH